MKNLEFILQPVSAFSFRYITNYRGVARIFQREGGHTMAFAAKISSYHCRLFAQKRVTKGGGGRGSREPRDPPSYALELEVSNPFNY